MQAKLHPQTVKRAEETALLLIIQITFYDCLVQYSYQCLGYCDWQTSGEHILTVNLQFSHPGLALFPHANKLASLFVDENLYNKVI